MNKTDKNQDIDFTTIKYSFQGDTIEINQFMGPGYQIHIAKEYFGVLEGNKFNKYSNGLIRRILFDKGSISSSYGLIADNGDLDTIERSNYYLSARKGKIDAIRRSEYSGGMDNGHFITDSSVEIDGTDTTRINHYMKVYRNSECTFEEKISVDLVHQIITKREAYWKGGKKMRETRSHLYGNDWHLSSEDTYTYNQCGDLIIVEYLSHLSGIKKHYSYYLYEYY